MSFDDWYMVLQELARKHGESVADRQAWKESWENGEGAEDAFFSEYPEHR